MQFFHTAEFVKGCPNRANLTRSEHKSRMRLSKDKNDGQRSAKLITTLVIIASEIMRLYCRSQMKPEYIKFDRYSFWKCDLLLLLAPGMNHTPNESNKSAILGSSCQNIPVTAHCFRAQVNQEYAC